MSHTSLLSTPLSCRRRNATETIGTKITSLPRLVLLAIICVTFAGCGKEKVKENLQEKLFEEKILNQNFVIDFADDHGTVLTPNYAGYVFILFKTDYYHGPMKAIKNGVTYQGSWKAEEEYGKLIIDLPKDNPELAFLARAWRFKSKSFSMLKLAPWGEPDGINVHMVKE